ncbi:MAG TPA: hypothetical protein VKH43_05250 [Thermoanaerobaculia bacterium]|nr:hypothetical protein [Thermoanaerobaculia bacterium]
MRNVVRVLVFLAYILALAAGFLLFAEPAPPKADARDRVAGIVGKIVKADYGDDRPALRRLYDELAPYTAQPGDARFASRVRYWRGFALWRRVLNGFNDKSPREEQEADLAGCVAEFDEALAKDPAFVDARVGKTSCLLSFWMLDRENQEKRDRATKEFAVLKEDAKTTASENPRVILMVAAGLWFAPADKGGGHDKALEMYQQGLRAARAKTAKADPLDPSWGEPELLSNIAWAHLNKETPDLDAAEANVRAALDIVPYWHYARDILMKQIRDAREGKAKTASGSS